MSTVSTQPELSRIVSENQNGYVVYPTSIGIFDFDDAVNYALDASAVNPEQPFRVECCDTEKVLFRASCGESA